MQHLETCLQVSEADRVLGYLVMVFYCLFPLDIQDETQLLPRGLFIRFLVQKFAACQKSDFGKHCFKK